MKTIVLNILHTDDIRSGPKLHIVKNVDNENTNMYEDVEFELEDDTYHVYYISLEIGDYNSVLLNKFNDLKDANIYAKQQYQLYTGDGPFIETGCDNNYHAIGTKEVMIIPEDMKCDINDKSEDGYEYLVIINSKIFESHSLNMFAIW